MALCAICGADKPAEQMVYSSWTTNHYCLDFKKCKARVKRKEVKNGKR